MNSDEHGEPNTVLEATDPAAILREYQRSDNPDLLRRAIELMQTTLAHSPADRDRAFLLADLGVALHFRYERAGEQADLDAAVSALRKAVTDTPIGDRERTGILGNLGNVLRVRFETGGHLTDLDEAIAALREGADTSDHADPSRYGCLNNLGIALSTRFQHVGRLSDLDDAIDALNQAIHAGPADHTDAAALRNLGQAMCLRYDRTRQPADLDAAINALQKAVDDTATHSHDAELFNTTLGNALYNRFDRTGQRTDLDAAISTFTSAVDATPRDHMHRPRRLGSLGDALLHRFERTEQLPDVDLAIRFFQEALDGTPAHDADRADQLSDLGRGLRVRFHRTGQRADLDVAITHLQEAAAGNAAGDPDHAHRLGNLGLALEDRFARSAQLSDLDSAVQNLQLAVKGIPDGDLSHSYWLSALAHAQRLRFQVAGDTLDLQAAIAAARRALNDTPEDAPGRVLQMHALGSTLLFAAQQTGQRADLDAAIALLEQAVTGLPSDHPGHALAEVNLGSAFYTRFGIAGQPADLDAATTLLQQGVDRTPEDHPTRPGMLARLGIACEERFERAGQQADLDSAIAALQQAVDLTPEDHPDRADHLQRLGNARLGQFVHQTGMLIDDAGHIDEHALRRRLHEQQLNKLLALKCFLEAALVETAPPESRLKAARTYGAAASKLGGDAADGLVAFEVAVELLPLVAWHGLDQATREERLAKLADLAADAAASAVAAGQPRRAAELLESGRSVLWTQALHLRTDLSLLTDRAPELAAEMTAVRAELDRKVPDQLSDPSGAGIDSMDRISASSVERRRYAAHRWDTLLGQARQVAGFANFLKPVPYGQLRAAAVGGPVGMVNTSHLGCHALIVTGASYADPRIVELPRLTHANAVQHVKNIRGVMLRAAETLRPRGQHRDLDPLTPEGQDRTAMFHVLEWLWDTIADPVLQALGHTTPPASDQQWPRVWWCPTGPLSLLPVHAAGRYAIGRPRKPWSFRAGRQEPELSVPSRVVSSYTPTLSALIRARQHPDPQQPVQQLTVGMPDTPGYNPLPAVGSEVATIGRYFPSSWPGLQLIGADATRQAVLNALPRYPWLHLACHGTQHRSDPSRSGFALADGLLTVTELDDVHVPGADLAFLSTCETAAGSDQLPDEALHLAGAMQIIGYRHVIATQWTIADSPAPQIADAFYQEITARGHPDSSEAAYALHQAVAGLRAEYPDDPLLWAPYVHFGP